MYGGYESAARCLTENPRKVAILGGMPSEEWNSALHVARYLDRADEFPRRAEGESVLLAHVPRDARRIIDLGIAQIAA